MAGHGHKFVGGVLPNDRCQFRLPPIDDSDFSLCNRPIADHAASRRLVPATVTYRDGRPIGVEFHNEADVVAGGPEPSRSRCIVDRCRQAPTRLLIGHAEYGGMPDASPGSCDGDEHIGSVVNLLFEAGYKTVSVTVLA